MNSLYRQLNPLSNNSIKQLMNMVRGAKNPQQFLMNIAQQNPQIQQVMNMVRSSGKSPKDLFYQLAQQRGINPDDILKELRT